MSASTYSLPDSSLNLSKELSATASGVFQKPPEPLEIPPDALTPNNRIWHFSGVLSHDAIERAHHELVTLEAAGAVAKRIAGVFVELAQNALFHGLPEKSGVQAEAALHLFPAHLALRVSSRATEQAAEKVRREIERLNPLDAEALRRLHRNTRNLPWGHHRDANSKSEPGHPSQTRSSGAGLGLIHIRRKSDFPLHCSLSACADEEKTLSITSFFLKLKQN
jgi:hypothetical protein